MSFVVCRCRLGFIVPSMSFALLALGGLFCARTTLQTDARTLTYWNGWYQMGHKVGYMQTIVQTYSDHYRFERRGKLTTEMMGTPTVATPNTICTTDRDFALKDFDFTMTTTGHDFHVVGAVRGNQMLMTATSGDQRQASTLDIAAPVYPLEALPNLIRSQNLQRGTKYEITVFDPMVQKTSNAEVTVIGPDRLTIRDTTREALKIALVEFNVPHTVWIDTLGAILKEEAPPGTTMILESGAEAMATRPTEPPLDIMQMYAVAADLRGANPRALKFFKFVLSGLPDRMKFDLEDETQKILNFIPLTMSITPPAAPTAPVSLPVTGETTATKPTLAVQSDNPLIIRKARELAAGSTDAVKVARAINDWVFANIRQKGTPSMPSATDVLQTMEGDCNEHAVLNAALCRAAGIPCKICVGLVYRDGFFWYHAWNKIYLGRWLPIDPTFGQFPVDATHLKLKEGEMDQQAQVLTVVGNLAIKTLETK